MTVSFKRSPKGADSHDIKHPAPPLQSEERVDVTRDVVLLLVLTPQTPKNKPLKAHRIWAYGENRCVCVCVFVCVYERVCDYSGTMYEPHN